jgi:hypothetical protein
MRAYGHRRVKRNRSEAKANQAADRRLCPVSVAHLLGVRYRRVAAAMRAAGACEPLDEHTVQGWMSGRGEMPMWLSELLADKASRAAAREAKARDEAVEAEHRRLLAEEQVQTALLNGKRRFRGAQLEVVQEWAFYAAKELVRNDGDVSELEAAVLEAVGVDPDVHFTWPLHVGGCDGAGCESCDARITELAAQRFEEQEAIRHERRQRARRDAEVLASGAITVGQHVLAYYDSRAGVVTKINRVTVKVKHIGGQSNHYALVERNYSPAYVHPLPAGAAAAAAAIVPGQRVEFIDRGRRQRSGEVVEVAGPLLRVRYRLASGQARTAWIDVLHLDTDGGQSDGRT